jgi:formamidopyrimidine-DNA glycosylase
VPELPEVETTRRGILPYLENQTIIKLDVRNPNLRWPVPVSLGQIMPQFVRSVQRRGKYIIIELDSGSILVHLGMSGSMRVLEKTEPLAKHDHVDFVLHDKLIRFNDPRRFGCILWAADWTQHTLIQHLGPEPLSELFDADYLYQKSRKRKTSIKQFVMDSHVVVGVGNIYANEALFLAGIHPNRAAGRISKKRYESLVFQIKRVLTSAIEQGGTTLRDFVGGDGKPGYFKQQLFVYGRAGLECKQCEKALTEIRQNGRSSVFCANCQT